MGYIQWVLQTLVSVIEDVQRKEREWQISLEMNCFGTFLVRLDGKKPQKETIKFS